MICEIISYIFDYFLKDNMLVSLAISVASIMIVFSILHYFLVKPISELTGRAQAIIDGDVSQTVQVKAKGELEVLARTINNMTESLRNLIIKLQNDSKEMYNFSISLSESVNHSMKATEELSSAIQQNSASVQEQSANIEEIQATIEEINASIEEINASTQQAKSVTQSSLETSQEGVDAVEHVVQRLTLVASASEKLKNTISRLSDESNEITQLVSVITNISDQTNLLALNAAIEAARAGEHGKGFTVVAEEVRKLAEESAKAAKNIIEIVSRNKKSTDEAVSEIDKVRDEVIESQNLADKAKSALNTIMSVTKEIDANTANIAGAVEQQASATERLNQAIDTIASAAQQISAGTQEFNANVEEQVQTARNLDASSSVLQEMAKNLEEVTKGYIVKSGAENK
jgi:methyl-accepting chemotaxis protein